MSAIAGIPILVEPEASARIAELGMQKEFELQLDQARRMIPELQQIHVTLGPPYDMGDEPRIVIEAWRGGTMQDHNQTRDQWIRWEIETFPPDVLRHFTTLIFLGSPDAR